MTSSNLRRGTVAVSVVAAAWIGLAGLAVQPTIPDDPAQLARLLADSPAAAIGLQAFVVSQVFWAIGLVGVGHLVAHRSRVLGWVGGALSGLGAFGHAVYGGAMLLQLALSPNTDAATAAITASQGGVFIPFLVMGLLGTTLGLVLLAVGLLRSRFAPRWVALALLAWLVVEFVLSSVAAWAAYLSITVGAVAFAALALATWRSDAAIWETAAEAHAEQPAKPALV